MAFFKVQNLHLKERDTLKCTTQKDESTTQKGMKSWFLTTQKEKEATQKANEELISTTQKPQLTTPKAIFHKIF